MPNFAAHNTNTLYATHGLQSYAAKCPPQLVRYGLQYYSKPGDQVLDPMVGSGTTLIEARLMGRHSLGFDIDPLARLIAQVKSQPIRDADIERAYTQVVQRCKCDLQVLQTTRVPAIVRERATPPDFLNRDHWFSPEVSGMLALLSHHIAGTQMTNRARDFLWLVFASLIMAKNSVANARDIIHSRTHYWHQSVPPDVMGRFDERVHYMRKKMAEYTALCDQGPSVQTSARLGDARHLRVADESTDLVFTSPPYATALDYTRAHFLAVAWMQRALGINLEDYRALAPRYIGSERGHWSSFSLDDSLSSELAQSVIEKLAQHSQHHAQIIQRYFQDMQQALGEIQRVLKDRRHAILVVCPSHIRKVDVPTHRILAQLAAGAGLKRKKEYTRRIYKHRRILPYLKEAFGRRMTTEYVLVLQKA